MKRNGFTLAELLIVLGITGVIAAVILPAINGLMPDKTKIMYLKVYDELGKNIKALCADTSIFPIILKNGNDDIDVSTIPLLNNEQPLKSPFKDDNKFTGDKKLCNLIAFSMGVNDACRDTTYPETPSFTTANGMKWWISETKRDINPAESKASYQTDIYVDVDSSKKSSDCMYGEENCKNPDRFKFLLAADGSLIPADPLGMKYVNTRKSWLKDNYDLSGDILSNLDNTLLNFQYNKVTTPCPPGQIYDGGICKDPVPECTGGKVLVGNVCTCPTGTVEENGVCKTPTQTPTQTPQQPSYPLGDCSNDTSKCKCGYSYNGHIINCFYDEFQNGASLLEEYSGMKLRYAYMRRVYQIPLENNLNYTSGYFVYGIKDEYEDMLYKTDGGAFSTLILRDSIQNYRKTGNIYYGLEPGGTVYDIKPSFLDIFYDLAGNDIKFAAADVSLGTSYWYQDDKYLYAHVYKSTPNIIFANMNPFAGVKKEIRQMPTRAQALASGRLYYTVRPTK